MDGDRLALRDSVRDVMRAEFGREVTRRAMADPDRWRPLWKSVTELGWAELAAPGEGFGAAELAVVLEGCGAALAPIPLLSSVGLAAGALRSSGTAFDAVRGDLARGVVGALAVQRAGDRLPGAPMTLRSGRVQGSGVAVPGAPRAELLVTLARVGDGGDVGEVGEVVAAVVRIGDGVTVRPPAECTDPAQPVADVDVDAVPLATAPVSVESALAGPLLAAAADLVGAAGAALDMSVDYARTRQQFGRPIGAFQGIKHALADNYVALERARSLTYAAAARLDDPDSSPTDAWQAAALAKAAAGDAALGCARTAVQVHGALGQTWEHDCHLYLRHAWQAAATLGDSRALYDAVGRRFAGATR